MLKFEVVFGMVKFVIVMVYLGVLLGILFYDLGCGFFGLLSDVEVDFCVF